MVVAGLLLGTSAHAADRLKEMQAANVANAKTKAERPYHFGSQGPGDVFSNHGSHSNRLIPFYTFGRKIRLDAVTGPNSIYRNPEKLRALYGFLPEKTVNPEAEYADQSDLFRVQRDAVARGVKHLFIVWFDGMDWPSTQAAAVAKTGKVYTEGKGSGLIFQEDPTGGSAQFGYYVTSPTHDKNTPDVDAQTVTIDTVKGLPGGYDARIAGPNPWTLGPLGPKAPGYLKGQAGHEADRAGVLAVGGVLHAYTDSSTSAAEFVTGVKAYNNGINVADDGHLVPTLFRQLQAEGWKVGTATSVPFNHASPSAMYAHNVDRDDYQDLARDMLGLSGVVQQSRKDELHPGLDVVIGIGFGQEAPAKALQAQGKNSVAGNAYITDADKAAIDVKNGGKYVVAQTTPGLNGA
ncbi:alkaline phosphatase, partial [Singulisphaera rosea]